MVTDIIQGTMFESTPKAKRQSIKRESDLAARGILISM